MSTVAGVVAVGVRVTGLREERSESPCIGQEDLQEEA
jgi:hypothetical protein